MSVRQAQEVAAHIQRLALPLNSVWNGRRATVEGSVYSAVELRGGMNITLLSPRPEDLDRLAAFTDQAVKRAQSWQSAAAEMESDERPEETARPEGGIYIASSHTDAHWTDRLREALHAVVPDERIFSGVEETGTEPGVNSPQWRHSAIQQARVGVVLLSADALASDFVQAEISALVDAARRSELALTWFLVGPCDWGNTPLAQYQTISRPIRPLSELPRDEAAQQIEQAATSLAKLIQDRAETPKASSRRRRETSEGPIDVENLAGTPFVADRSVVNNASIAFLAEHHGKSLLICGDASATVLGESIRALIRQRGVHRLRVDAFVVPHGGSAGNLNREVLELLDCHRYFIATNGERYGHPNRETIARILAFGRTDRSEGLTLVFNYRTPATAVWDDAPLQARWNYRASYPSRDDGGIKVQI